MAQGKGKLLWIRFICIEDKKSNCEEVVKCPQDVISELYVTLIIVGSRVCLCSSSTQIRYWELAAALGIICRRAPLTSMLYEEASSRPAKPLDPVLCDVLTQNCKSLHSFAQKLPTQSLPFTSSSLPSPILIRYMLLTLLFMWIYHSLSTAEHIKYSGSFLELVEIICVEETRVFLSFYLEHTLPDLTRL